MTSTGTLKYTGLPLGISFYRQVIMKVSHIVIASMLMLALAPQGFAAGKGGTFKCWINKDGIRECGNEVPPNMPRGRPAP